MRLRYMSNALITLASFLTIATLLPSLLQAQTTYGSIVGTVTDSLGAVIPSATVTITNLGTGEARVANSDQSGNFSIVSLLPADYKVQVEKANFKRYMRQPVHVEVGATVRTDVALQVGATSETVVVNTQSPLLQTDSSSVNQEVGGTTMQEMPLNGRNTMNLLALTAGVVPQGSTSGSTSLNQNGGHTNNAGWGWYQIGGSLAGESATYVDGAPVNVLGGNTVGLVMTQDAVQEFNVATNNVSAEFGRFGGGVVNMASKSGTNSFHGSAYEYLRNSFFNANDYFNKLQELTATTPKPNKPVKWNQNQYGVVVGGPIKKDKAFFHFTWEGFKIRSAAVSYTNVPTTAMQSGTFTNQITAPAGSSCIVSSSGSGTSETWTITNLSTCGDPMAAILKGYYPPPNTTPSASNSYSNFATNPPEIDNQNQYNARIDYVLSSKQHIFGRYTYWNLVDAGSNPLNDYGGWKTQRSTSVDKSHQVVLGDSYTFSPATLLDVRLSYMRQFYPVGLPYSLGTDPSLFPGTYYTTVASQMSVFVLPELIWGSGAIHNFINGIGGATYSLDYYDTYSLGASLIHSWGKHSVKAGAEVRLMDDIHYGGSNSGDFFFNNGHTGDEWADFLLGDIESGSCYGSPCGYISTANSTAAYNYYQGYYVTDNFQATHRLTLNLGLRYELPGGVYERHNLAAVLLPKASDTGVTGLLALVDSSLHNSGSAINVKHDLFAPRVGFAYRLGNNMAIRAGYGISYLPIDLSTGSAVNASAHSSGTGIFPSGSPINAYANICTSSQLYVCVSSLIQPPGRAYTGEALIKYLGYYGNSGATVSGPVPDQRYPYVQQWNAAVSRQMKGDWMVDLSYNGSKGTFLPAMGSSLNQLPDSYDSLGSGLKAATTCAGGTTVGQCDRPYPYYGNVSDSIAFNSSTVYHALQAKTEKRFHSGGILMANYTWGKIIGDTDSKNGSLEQTGTNTNVIGTIQDYNNMKAERSVLTFSVPQRALVSYVLNLPFGKGQKWGSNVNGAASQVISGWSVNGITTFQHGFHLAFTDNDSSVLSNNFGAGVLRPNVVAGCPKKSPVSGNARIGEWFNIACFQGITSGYAFGSEPRVDSNLFAQGIDNFDFSAMKTANITERTNVQFRAEFFNLFNHKQLGTPFTAVKASTYGTISNDNNQPRLVQFSLRVNF